MLAAANGSLGGDQAGDGQLLHWPCCEKVSAPACILLEQLDQHRDVTCLPLWVSSMKPLFFYFAFFLPDASPEPLWNVLSAKVIASPNDGAVLSQTESNANTEVKQYEQLHLSQLHPYLSQCLTLRMHASHSAKGKVPV